MSWWYPQLNGAGWVASGNGEIWIDGQPLAPGQSPQWDGLEAVLAVGPDDHVIRVDVPTGAPIPLGVLANARVGNVSGVSVGPGHWAAWNAAQGLFRDGVVVDPAAAPGAIDQRTGALYYLTPYQADRKQIVMWPGTILRRGAIATDLVAGDDCCTWGEYQTVRTLYGWSPESGVVPLSPLAATEVLFVGVPVMTPEGRWLVTQTHRGLIVYPWQGSTRGYILEGDWLYQHARYRSGLLDIVGTDSRGTLLREALDLAAPRVDLSQYYPTSGTGPNPEPPDPPDPPDPEEPMQPPIVTVDSWTLADVLEGREMRFRDSNNPELQIAARVWVEGGVMYASLTNKAGSARTGSTSRVVTPCSQGNPDPPNPEPPDPPKPEPSRLFTLQTVHGTYLTVGADAFLGQTAPVRAGDRGRLLSASPVAGWLTPAVFEEVPQPDGRIGLKADGWYVASESDYRLRADRSSVGAWEFWQPVDLDDGERAYQAWQGTYLSAHENGTVYADQVDVGGWETFRPTTVTTGRQPITAPLRTDGRIFRDATGQPWRYRGVSAFPLCRLFTNGVDLQPFLRSFPGFNLLRVWDYVPWPGTGWESCTVSQWRAFCLDLANQGWYVEVTLLTDDDPARIPAAQALARGLTGAPNVLLEIGNEPQTNKHIDTRALESACRASGLLFSSGNYEANAEWFGTYGTAHTPRDQEWCRKSHDLLEYYNGGGPHAPTEPACRAPWVADEPIRPEQATASYGKVQDYLAYGASCSQMGAGATFHYAGGRFGELPNPEDQSCRDALLRGLLMFDAGTPLGPYRRIDEQGGTLRTYVIGDTMTRIRPTTPDAPEPGWTARDEFGICWTR